MRCLLPACKLVQTSEGSTKHPDMSRTLISYQKMLQDLFEPVKPSMVKSISYENIQKRTLL